jgi:hypothetical protein
MPQPETTAKRDAHNTPDRRKRQALEYDLRYVSAQERVSAFPGLFDLQDAGLIKATHEGWGVYSVALTPLGQRALNDVA